MRSYDRIMVWGAHPDDEIVIGGMIAAMADAGTEVTVVSISRGDAGYCRPEWADTIVETRKREAAACDAVLGIAHRIMLGWPDLGVRHDARLTHELIRALRTYRPQALFTHGAHDRHSDHIAVHAMTDEIIWQAAENILADHGAPYAVPLVFLYQGLDDRDGPVIELDVTAYAERKARAWRTQASQMEMLPKIVDWVDHLSHIEETGGTDIERFVLWQGSTLADFPELGG